MRHEHPKWHVAVVFASLIGLAGLWPSRGRAEGGAIGTGAVAGAVSMGSHGAAATIETLQARVRELETKLGTPEGRIAAIEGRLLKAETALKEDRDLGVLVFIITLGLLGAGWLVKSYLELGKRETAEKTEAKAQRDAETDKAKIHLDAEKEKAQIHLDAAKEKSAFLSSLLATQKATPTDLLRAIEKINEGAKDMPARLGVVKQILIAIADKLGQP
jgi:hypothetical protein